MCNRYSLLSFLVCYKHVFPCVIDTHLLSFLVCYKHVFPCVIDTHLLSFLVCYKHVFPCVIDTHLKVMVSYFVVFQTATSVSNFEVRGDQLVVGENRIRIIFVSSSGATRTITYTVRKTQSQGLLTWPRKLKYFRQKLWCNSAH